MNKKLNIIIGFFLIKLACGDSEDRVIFKEKNILNKFLMLDWTNSRTR